MNNLQTWELKATHIFLNIAPSILVLKRKTFAKVFNTIKRSSLVLIFLFNVYNPIFGQYDKNQILPWRYKKSHENIIAFKDKTNIAVAKGKRKGFIKGEFKKIPKKGKFTLLIQLNFPTSRIPENAFAEIYINNNLVERVEGDYRSRKFYRFYEFSEKELSEGKFSYYINIDKGTENQEDFIHDYPFILPFRLLENRYLDSNQSASIDGLKLTGLTANDVTKDEVFNIGEPGRVEAKLEFQKSFTRRRGPNIRRLNYEIDTTKFKRYGFKNFFHEISFIMDDDDHIIGHRYLSPIEFLGSNEAKEETTTINYTLAIVDQGYKYLNIYKESIRVKLENEKIDLNKGFLGFDGHDDVYGSWLYGYENPLLITLNFDNTYELYLDKDYKEYGKWEISPKVFRNSKNFASLCDVLTFSLESNSLGTKQSFFQDFYQNSIAINEDEGKSEYFKGIFLDREGIQIFGQKFYKINFPPDAANKIEKLNQLILGGWESPYGETKYRFNKDKSCYIYSSSHDGYEGGYWFWSLPEKAKNTAFLWMIMEDIFQMKKFQFNFADGKIVSSSEVKLVGIGENYGSQVVRKLVKNDNVSIDKSRKARGTYEVATERLQVLVRDFIFDSISSGSSNFSNDPKWKRDIIERRIREAGGVKTGNY